MVNVDINNMLTTLVSTFRPRFKYVKGNGNEIIEEGIAVKFAIRLDDYDDDFNTFYHKDFVVIFTSNTSVFVAGGEDTLSLKPEDFENTSNHDSCWNYDGLTFLTDTYFGMAKAINKDRVENGLKEIAPIAMIQSNRFNSVTAVRIHKKRIDDTYFYKLTKITDVPLFEESK